VILPKSAIKGARRKKKVDKGVVGRWRRKLQGTQGELEA